MDADVLIVGAGPTGLLLSGDLAAAGIRVIVAEARPGLLEHARAWGLQPRSQETVALRGMWDEIAQDAPRMDGTTFGGVGLDYTPLDTMFPFFLHVPQTRIERVLRERAQGLGAEVRYSTTVESVVPAEQGVVVGTSSGPMTARFVVGADGGRGVTRQAIGVGMSGTPATSTSLFADVELADPADADRLRGLRNEHGLILVLRRPPTMHRVIVVRFAVDFDDLTRPVSAAEVSSAIETIAGFAPGFSSVAWASRFSDSTRLADRYRHGNVFLAGDAAHLHSPFGGQGMNLGLQDAANLGWRLARAVHGDVDFLDGYEDERRPVAAAVLDNTRAQTQLFEASPLVAPLREAFIRLATRPAGNRALGEDISGLAIDYCPDDPGPVGRFLPTSVIRRVGLGELARRMQPEATTEVCDDDGTFFVRADGYVAKHVTHHAREFGGG